MPLIDPPLLQARLAPMAGRFDVDALDECDSTSSELLRRAAQGAPAGSVVVADKQRAGRGRRGRSWLSSAGAGLTFSLLWRTQQPASQLGGLSLAVGVAVAQVLESLGAENVVLKWPNDVLLKQGESFAKLAGILIELSSERRGTQVCIGIGLNVLPPEGDFPQAVAGLSQAMPSLPERHDLLAALLIGLQRHLDRFAVDGFAGVKTAWLTRHAWQDKPVQLLADGEQVRCGRCCGVDDDGALLLDCGQGPERILAGDLSLRPA